MCLSEGLLAIVEVSFFVVVVFLIRAPNVWFRMFTSEKDVNQIAYAKKTLQ